MKCETRNCEAELRLHDNPDGMPTIEGYAAVFNSPSLDLGGFREVIRPGAFSDVLLANPDVRALIDHQSSPVLGRTRSNTLRLTQDSRGLRFEIDPPDSIAANELITSIRRGDISGSSFAFMVEKSGAKWTKSDQGRVREIRQFSELRDVSIVTYPAYPATDVAIRSLRDWERETDWDAMEMELILAGPDGDIT